MGREVGEEGRVELAEEGCVTYGDAREEAGDAGAENGEKEGKNGLLIPVEPRGEVGREWVRTGEGERERWGEGKREEGRETARREWMKEWSEGETTFCSWGEEGKVGDWVPLFENVAGTNPNRCIKGLGGNPGALGALLAVGVVGADALDISDSLRGAVVAIGCDTGGEECSLMNTYDTGC